MAKKWTIKEIRKAEAQYRKKYPREWKAEMERQKRAKQVENQSEIISKGILKAIGTILVYIFLILVIFWLLSALIDGTWGIWETIGFIYIIGFIWYNYIRKEP